MAYRIRYSAEKRQSIWDNVQMQCVIAGAVFLLVLLIKLVWPDGRAALTDVFEPGEQAAMVAAAQVLKEGGTFREGLVALCRGVLMEAGYAP